jgi:hypothetical protein
MLPSALTVWPFVFLCLLFTVVAEVGAKSVPEKGGPPILAPVDLRVEGRKPVRFFLKAHGLQRSPVKFVIRREPAFGRLRLVKEISGDSVEVEYVPPGDSTIKEDSFWFAGSNAQGFSSDVRARIQISDLGPQLKVAALLDFETVRVGQSKQLTLELSNVGDQLFEGPLTVSAPWEIEGAVTSLALAPGENRFLRVVFKPLKVGTARGIVQLGGGNQVTVQLRGEASEWVVLDRDPVSLLWDDSKRQAISLTLSNPGEEALEVQVEASPALEHESRITLVAGAECSLPLRWSGNSVPGGWGTLLLLSQTGMRRVVVWTLDAVLSGLGPSLVLKGEGGFQSVRRTFTNTGGRAGTWRFRCTEPFFLGNAAVLSREIQPPPEDLSPRIAAREKKVEGHSDITGFVWDQNQSRYVPSRGSAKPPDSARSMARPSAVAGGPKIRASELVCTLQPDESFELLIAVEGRSADSAGSFFVDGPGQRHEEPIQVEKGDARVPSKGVGAAQVPLAELKPAALPAVAPQRMPALPPPVGAVLPPASAPPGYTPLPRLIPQMAGAPVGASDPTSDILTNALLPGLFLDGFRISDITSDSAIIRFPVPPGVKPEHIVVRYGELVDGAVGGAMDWVPFPDSQRRGRLADGQVEIRLRGLRAGMNNFIDLLGPPSGNGWRDRLLVTQIDTAPTPSLLSPRRPFSWLVLSTAVAGGYFLRRRSFR